MELIVILTTVLCISLSVMLTPSASQPILVQSSHHQGQRLPASVLRTLPRKLRLIEEAATVNADANGGKELYPSNNKLKGSALSGRKRHREGGGVVRARRSGTRREWMEVAGADAAEFFTMDYSGVRRRTPIHNKSVPVRP